MQKVAELAQLTYTDKIHQQAKVGQTMACLACLPLNYALFKTQKILSANHADFNLTHLIQRFCDFCGQITLFSAFSHRKHILVCLQLNWAVLGFMSQKATFYSLCCETTLLLALWHRKDVSVCLSLNLHCFQLYLTED